MGYLDNEGLKHLWGKVENHSLASKALTQAEYDALPEEERKGKVFLITDCTQAEVERVSLEEYDTDDGWHVRKWSDGYVEMRKKLEVSFPASQWDTYPYGWAIKITDPILLPISLTERYSETMSIVEGVNGALLHAAIFCQQNSLHGLDVTDQWNAFRPWSAPSGSTPYVLSLAVTGRWK